MKTFIRSFALALVALTATACSSGSDQIIEEPGGDGGAGGAANTGGRAGADAGKGGSAGAANTGGRANTGGSPGSGGSPGPSQWVKVGKPSEGACADVTALKAKPEADIILASTWKVGIFASTDGAATFTKLGSIDHGPVELLIDPVTPTTFWESGMYGGPIVKTTDNGATFTTLGSASHLDGMSVDFSDPNRMTLLTGGHEQKQNLQRSTDGGQTWTNIGTNLGASLASCTYPLIIDAATYLVGCSGNGWIAGDLGVYRSTDSGSTWARASSASATDQGPMPDPLMASDGTIYWSIVYNRGMLVSTDKGVTWAKRFAWNDIMPATPTELPDGRVVAPGSKGKQLQATSDKGKTWKTIATAVPYDPAGITYSKYRKAFYIYHSDCSGGMNDAIMMHPFDWTTPDGKPPASDAGVD